MFIDPPGFTGKVREGVLTPPYEAAYKERWRQQQELGEVQYDRLTHCEPVGYPRWLLEPYSHEFVNLPQRVVPDQRLRAGDTPRLHRSGAQERVRHALLVRRHDWILGRQQARHAHEVSAAGRLHALVADDEQSVRVGRNVGAQAVPGRHRAARGSGHVLRSARLRQTRQRRLRVSSREGTRGGRPSRPALGMRDEQQRRLRQRHDDVEAAGRARVQGSRAARRSFRNCRASRAIRSTTPRSRPGRSRR